MNLVSFKPYKKNQRLNHPFPLISVTLARILPSPPFPGRTQVSLRPVEFPVEEVQQEVDVDPQVPLEEVHELPRLELGL